MQDERGSAVSRVGQRCREHADGDMTQADGDMTHADDGQRCRAHADGGRVRAQAGFLSTTALSRAALESAETARARARKANAKSRETKDSGVHAKQRPPKPTPARDLEHGSSTRHPHDRSIDQLAHAKRALHSMSARSPASPPSAPAASAIDPMDPLAMCERALQSAFLSTTALTRAALQSAEATRAKRAKAKSDKRVHATQPPPKPTPARNVEHGSSTRYPHDWNIDQLAHAKRALQDGFMSARSPVSPPSPPAASAIDSLLMCERALQSASPWRGATSWRGAFNYEIPNQPALPLSALQATECASFQVRGATPINDCAGVGLGRSTEGYEAALRAAYGYDGPAASEEVGEIDAGIADGTSPIHATAAAATALLDAPEPQLEAPKPQLVQELVAHTAVRMPGSAAQDVIAAATEGGSLVAIAERLERLYDSSSSCSNSSCSSSSKCSIVRPELPFWAVAHQVETEVPPPAAAAVAKVAASAAAAAAAAATGGGASAAAAAAAGGGAWAAATEAAAAVVAAATAEVAARPNPQLPLLPPPLPGPALPRRLETHLRQCPVVSLEAS
eukprot:scaffold61806_cov67-Phaeocystis_antarctica.AAC.4